MPLVLLGAGASRDARLPDSFGLTSQVMDDIASTSGRTSDEARAIRYVHASVLRHDIEQGQDSEAGVDVERLFSSVYALANRNRDELAPFAAWDSGIYNLGSDERGGNVFETLADSMLRSLRHSLRISEGADLSYLEPLTVDSMFGTIVTLNYDRTMEMAFDKASVPFDTGIERWASHGDIKWRSGLRRYIKLHGSVDWYSHWRRRDREHLQLPTTSFVVVEDDEDFDYDTNPLLVFGQTGKLTPFGPFLELRSAFVTELRQCRDLLVIGYSFRDEHVNEVLRRWLNANNAARIIVVDPSAKSYMYPEGIQPDLLTDLVWTLRKEGSRPVPGKPNASTDYVVDARCGLVPLTAKEALAELVRLGWEAFVEESLQVVDRWPVAPHQRRTLDADSRA